MGRSSCKCTNEIVQPRPLKRVSRLSAKKLKYLKQPKIPKLVSKLRSRWRLRWAVPREGGSSAGGEEEGAAGPKCG